MRTIPIQLQEHLNEPVTTTTRCIRLQLRDGTVFGIAMLDRDVVYDHNDGFGEVTYIASNGFDPNTISSDTAYSVTNTESRALVAADIPGITIDMVEAGELDDGEWTAFLLNYENAEPGSAAILDAGDIGEVRTEHGMVWIPELLSYAMRLRQAVGSVWQRPCRAIFGTPAAGHTGCGFDAESLWVDGVVESVGAENNRTFMGDVTSTTPINPFPGRVEFETGDNVGRQYGVESFSNGTVTLSEIVPYPIQAGDTYRIRPDCRKRYQQDCIGTWDNGINFKGEPLIPVGDASAISTPGSQLPGGGGWIGEQPPTEQQ